MTTLVTAWAVSRGCRCGARLCHACRRAIRTIHHAVYESAAAAVTTATPCQQQQDQEDSHAYTSK